MRFSRVTASNILRVFDQSSGWSWVRQTLRYPRYETHLRHAAERAFVSGNSRFRDLGGMGGMFQYPRASCQFLYRNVDGIAVLYAVIPPILPTIV